MEVSYGGWYWALYMPNQQPQPEEEKKTENEKTPQLGSWQLSRS